MTQSIKAITIPEPWVTLIVLGEKEYDTRKGAPWNLCPIAIHAAASTFESMTFFGQEPFRSLLAKHKIPNAKAFLFGCVIAVARILQVDPCEPLRDKISDQERALGNWRDGWKAWKIGHVMPLKSPIPATGQPGLWDWDAPPGLLQSYLARVPDRPKESKKKVRRPTPTALDQ